MAQTRIVGEKALMKALNGLGRQSTVNKVSRPAYREAAAEIRKKAKANAPKETGLLKKSIKSVVRTGKIGVYAVIGPAYGFKQIVDDKPRDPAKYAHLVEFGTTHSQPKPFLRPAYNAVPSNAIIAGRLRTELAKEAKRRASKR